MRSTYLIGLDTHCQFTEMAVITAGRGQLYRRARCPTTIPDLRELLATVPHPREVVLEEGPLGDWLWRNLAAQVDKITLCDPRRNRLIAKDSDKDDRLDAEKLAQLYRGGYIKAVHHPESFDRMVFKRHVTLYHDRVRQRVRHANLIMAVLRQYGLFVRESAFRTVTDTEGRRELLQRLPAHPLLRADLRGLWQGYDALVEQVRVLRNQLVRRAQREPQIRRFAALPGVKWIRAATFFVYVDTPWRFPSKSALWKYLGIGLERRHSGAGPERVGVPTYVHRPLKAAILGAAKSAAAARDNPFAEQYERCLHAGRTPRIARRNVARSQAAVMWGMWKNGSVYQPEAVGRATPHGTVPPSSTER